MTDETQAAGGTESGYSPILAQMLKVDPNKIGSISLSALGRQAMGSDTEEYKRARADVDAARETMRLALENRKGRIDPAMLALAQGFLAPTRTGSFGESLGTAAGAYGKAQEGEENRQAQLAKMRYELANARLNEESEAAKLGLSVAGKLTPKMTAYQQQVQAEGIDPRSPQGIARVKELLALDKSTPEMKTFAAQAGLSITDPTFAARYKMFEDTKPLRETAARLGLDINDPTQRQRAQQEMQRDTFRTQNPDLAKALQRFGGDPLKPADLTRAQRELQTDVNLERTGRQMTIAQQNAQITRTKQEIDDHIRQGDVNAIAAKAVEVGVPLDPKSSFAGLNKVEAAKKREAMTKEANKYITETIAPLVAGADADILDLQRALKLNSEISTGYTYGLGMGIGDIAKLTSGDRAKISEFDSLAAKAAKMNRIPGDSNVSNADMKWMALGTFSSDKAPSTNKNIIEFNLAQRQRDRDFNSYLQNYAAVNGAITPHAQAQWRKYLEANPITTRDEKGTIKINPSRMTYQQYFSMPRVKVDAQGREQQ
jgi:hypothetical protein